MSLVGRHARECAARFFTVVNGSPDPATIARVERMVQDMLDEFKHKPPCSVEVALSRALDARERDVSTRELLCVFLDNVGAAHMTAEQMAVILHRD